MRILLGISGGIAAYKTPDLVRRLKKAGHEVRVVCTRNALELVSRVALETVSGEPVLCDTFAPRTHAGIEHIDLAAWAELVLVAPATANVLAKLACGLADDLLTTVLLACPAPLWLAPGMNTRMWEHPATRANVARLVERGARVIGPDSGELACGTTGPGRMTEPDDLVKAVSADLVKALGAHHLAPRPFAGRTVLVTAGATREHLDPVRFLSNPSTGRMGVAVARAAKELGATVLLVHAHLEVPPPPGVEAVFASSAADLQRAVLAHRDRADLVVMTAAVGDWMPAQVAPEKLKKETAGENMTVALVRTPDILAGLVADRARAGAVRPWIVGFAAETAGGDGARLSSLAREKLARKGCDALFANDVSLPGAGFATGTNQGLLVFADGRELSLGPGTKDQVASALVSEVSSALGIAPARE